MGTWTLAKIERPGVVLQDGHPTHITWAVADVDKDNQVLPGSNHCTKIIVVPFDGVAFDEDFGGSGGGAGGAGTGGAGGTGGVSTTGGVGGTGGTAGAFAGTGGMTSTAGSAGVGGSASGQLSWAGDAPGTVARNSGRFAS